MPGTAEAILGGKHLLRKALGVKVANGDMLQYFADHPEKLKEKQKRDRRKMEKTAEVMPYQQKTQWSCSASCFKAVAAHHGLRIPELVAINLVGAVPGRGAETTQIAEAARKVGFQAFEYSFDSIDQARHLLDQDLPIICDIQSFNNPGKGHYVVMVSADEQRVQLMDPNTPGNWRVISRADMNARWWDRAMAPPHQLMWRWGVVIVPPEGA
jgi:predicted double-glycine peptidase